MPIIYLSPSTQEKNQYVIGGSEEYHMNQLADAMIPYLVSNGIQYNRNTPDMTAGSSIRQGNEGWYDFYLALHSNAAGEGNYGKQRGVIAFYFPGSVNGHRAADIFVRNMKEIYPLPNLVRTEPTTGLGEVARSRAPAVLIEIGYHDNETDALWITSQKTVIAQNLVRSLTEYFDLPFIWPITPIDGHIAVGSGSLNLRARPEIDAHIITAMQNGAPVRIYGQWQGWYVVHYGGMVGYAVSEFIKI